MKRNLLIAIAEAKRIHHLLSQKKYNKIGDISNNLNLLPSELADAVIEYGRNIIMPPENHEISMDISRIKNTPLPTWFIAAPLWTTEDGESDLFLEMTIEVQDHVARVVIDGLHVL